MYIYHINFNLPQSPSLQKLKANAYWQCDYVRIVNFKLKTSWHIIAEKPTTSIYNQHVHGISANTYDNSRQNCKIQKSCDFHLQNALVACFL